MTAPAWLNDRQPFPGSENGAFVASADPNMGYMPTPPSNNLEYSQLQMQQQQHLQQARQYQAQHQQHQQMQNGIMRHDSPAFQNPVYNTNQVIPAKRPRPREDSLATSPRQASGGLPNSRSQTPQSGAYPGYQGTMNGSQAFQSGPQYSPVQQVNGTAPSPMLSEQGFNPSMAPPRVQNMSPAVFSPTPQNFASQPSPVHSEHASRNGTPHNGVPPYGQGPTVPGTPTQPFNQPMHSPANASLNNPNGMGMNVMNQYQQMSQGMSPQQQQDRMEVIRRQSALRQMQSHGMQNRQFPGQPIGPGAPMNPYQQPGGRQPQQQPGQQAAMRARHAEQFVRGVHTMMQQRGLPFNPHLTVFGRQIPPYHLFMAVMQMGSSRRLTTAHAWGSLAQKFGFAPHQTPQAAQELHMYYQQNLLHYEFFYMHSRQQQQQQAMAQAQQMKGNMPNGVGPQVATQLSPGKRPMMNHQVAPNQHHAIPQASSSKRPAIAMRHNRPPSPQVRSSPRGVARSENPVPELSEKERFERYEGDYEHMPLPINPPLSPTFEPSLTDLDKARPVIHNGMHTDLEGDGHLWNQVTSLLKIRPSMPESVELGSINLRAISLSLKSGLPGEVKVALDTLLTVSTTPLNEPLRLDLCEDLLEALIECAEDQIDLLADNSPEISDAVVVANYQDVIRGAKLENLNVQEIPGPGSLAYDLDVAVRRLLCITNILRNLSYDEKSDNLPRPARLAESFVVKFVASAIRYLGTRSMLLRTHKNASDFSKDLVIFLYNMANKIELPSREEASYILSFLLSFAPQGGPYGLPVPSPSLPSSTEDPPPLCFSRYDSQIHRYYPPAIGTFAELLAKDDPNRNFYRSIFAIDSTTSNPPNDLFIRSFGFCIAGLPDRLDLKSDILTSKRAPFVAHGLLAAEILSSLIPPGAPSTSSTLTSNNGPSATALNGQHRHHPSQRAYQNLPAALLASTDAWAPCLSRLLSRDEIKYSGIKIIRKPHPNSGVQMLGEVEVFPGAAMLAEHGLALLRKLAEKAKSIAGANAVNASAGTATSATTLNGTKQHEPNRKQTKPNDGGQTADRTEKKRDKSKGKSPPFHLYPPPRAIDVHHQPHHHTTTRRKPTPFDTIIPPQERQLLTAMQSLKPDQRRLFAALMGPDHVSPPPPLGTTHPGKIAEVLRGLVALDGVGI